jgi:hypothetical protein
MLIEKLALWWSVNDVPPCNLDLIVPVTHGATKIRLTNGARSVLNETLHQLSTYEHCGIFPRVAWGIFGRNPDLWLEKKIKLPIFNDLTNYFIGAVWSTIEECHGVKDSLPTYFNPEVIVVITDQAHSRRCRLIWKVFFPKSKIYIVSVPIAETVDPESPMLPYRKMWKILWNQTYPTPFFWFAGLFGTWGLLKLERFHQPVVKTK